MTGLDPQARVLRERRAHIVQAYERLDPRRMAERPAAVAGPLGVSEINRLRRWLRDGDAR
ncbi:MAG: hypothetical protein KF686_18595 [Ramlibacter sp.]|nr:hypothetical protein [Ramlibacter sp.]